MLKNYIYTCSDCNHEWTDARQKAFVEAPLKFGCRKCKSKNLSYKPEPPKEFNRANAPSITDPAKLGRIKPSDGLRDILKNIKKNNRGSTINIE